LTLELKPGDRAKLRRDLLAQRQGYSLTDADFVTTVLKISLNTYKKCIQPDADAPLRLKRQTFVSLFSNARLSPESYGLDLALPAYGAQYGGYTEEEFGFLAGRYTKYRRSFLTGVSFNRSELDIRWNEHLSCLSFREQVNYVSDRGVPQQTEYGGDIYIHQDRQLMTLLSIESGEVRTVLIHLPSRPVRGRPRQPFRLRGLQLVHAYPKGVYQPTVSPVLVEEITAPRKGAKPQGGTVSKDDPDYARIADEMAHTEQHAVVITSLLSRSASA